MTIMYNAVYVDGRRTASPVSIEETRRITRDQGGTAWIDLAWPEPAEIRVVAEEFSLHHIAVEAAIDAHQRPKIEQFDDALFVVLHPARNMDRDHDGRVDRVEFGEVHAWVGPDYVVTVRRSPTPELEALRTELEREPSLLRHGPNAILATLLDQVVDTYWPVISRLRSDVDQVEDKLFSRDPAVSLHIYEVTREVIRLQRATHPLVDILQRLLSDRDERREREPTLDPGQAPHLELRRYLRSILDHAIKHAETADTFRSLLTNALDVHSTLVTQEQNDEIRRQSEASLQQNVQMKRISAWAAILFAPTLIGTIYGMNFDHMPELHWTLGYPLALTAMVGLGAVLYRLFKRVGWL